MAVYADPSPDTGGIQRRANVNEYGFDIRVISGPDISTTGSWGDYLYYWACQITFHDSTGTQVGGGHCGVQAFNSADLPPGSKKSVVNWGVYDDTYGGNLGNVFRSSNPIDSDKFIDINSEVSFGFDYSYNEWIRFRVFKSPKQNWLATELRPGIGQQAPYIGTDQQANEVAFRCTIENLTRGTPPVQFHDCLVKGASGDKPIGYGIMWMEVVAGAGYPGGMAAAEVNWPDNPDAHFRHPDWDGPGMVSQYALTYKVSTANVDTTVVAGSPGYIRMRGPTTRTNANGTLVAPPANYWDTPPAVNTSSPATAVTPVPERPYY